MRRTLGLLAVVIPVLLVGAVATSQAQDLRFKLDHFKVYRVAPSPGIERTVALQGQFDKEPIKAAVRGPVMFANAVSKNQGEILDKNAHLNWYSLRQEKEEPKRKVIIRNQFAKGDKQELILGQPRFLLVPTKKVHGDDSFPLAQGLDHFKVYEVLKAEPVPTKVVLVDQFEREENEAAKAVFFCVPVNKQFRDSVTKINNVRDHLTVYAIRPRDQKIEIAVSDQLGENKLRITASQFLCLPTMKLEFTETDDPTTPPPPPPFKLDHFKAYKVASEPGIEREVALRGQFDREPIAASVRGPVMFANAVAKNRGTINDKNAHLNWYSLRQEKEEPKRTVIIRNQFAGGRDQKLILGQPRFLLVPTKKIHGDDKFPLSETLDHFKVYEVLEAEPVSESVALVDQFERERNEATKPVYFCVPVEKRFRDRVTKINNEKDHLTVYAIRPKDQKINIEVSDQLGENKLRITASQFLCLPTMKLEIREN